jgi:hypothetical protein
VRSKDMVGAFDQQTSKICVTGVSDAELRIMISGLTSPRSQAQVATHIAASSEPFLAAEGQHEGQGGEVTDAVTFSKACVSGYSVWPSCCICRSYCLILTVISATCWSTGPSACASPGGMTARQR